MSPSNALLERLRRNELASMLSVRMSRGPEIALLAAAAGFDGLYVDLEHSTLSLGEASHICMAALGAGITPLVRVPAIDEAHVSRLLDGGAMGIIGPHVRSAKDARRLVSLCKFPPVGKRSNVAWLPQIGYRSLEPARLYPLVNASTAVIAMVEDREALANVEAIAAVEGLDIVLVGTSDLRADMGLEGQADHPLIDAAVQRVIAACRAHGKAVGIGGLARNEALMHRFVANGARLVSMGTDLTCLLEGARRQAGVVERLRPAA